LSYVTALLFCVLFGDRTSLLTFAWAVLELILLPTPQKAAITGVHHHTQLGRNIFNFINNKVTDLAFIFLHSRFKNTIINILK
jgi:hypothetical protein